MTTAIYDRLTEQEKREVRMYGCTEAQMREAVESSITFKFTGPAMVVAGMMSDAQEMIAFGGDNEMVREDQRQLLNRAKWVLFTYIMDREGK